MNCQECEEYIDPYVDNELDVATTILVEQHLRGCSRCQQLLETRKSVQALLNNPRVRFETPETLPEKIQSVLPPGESIVKQRSETRFVFPRFTIPLALAAAVVAMIGLAFLYQPGISDRARGRALAQDVIASHVRSLLATHLLDVPSTDQHTVKPWFDGKLKFSPPVHDFAEHGFPLVGGRLDYFDGREVAAVVYQRHGHIINVFIWPSESGRSTPVESFVKDGYNVSHWVRDGFEFWVVSDVNAEDLKSFTGLEMQSD